MLRKVECLVLGVITLAIAGTLGGAAISGASPPPSTEQSTAVGAPPAMAEATKTKPPGITTPPQGPELTLDEVRQEAWEIARSADDASPANVSVAHGTFQAAQRAFQSASGQQAAQSHTSAPWGDGESLVFAVVMHGDFTLNSAPTPQGGKAPNGEVFAVVLDDRSGFVEGEYLGRGTPDLATVGPTVALEAP